MTVAEQKVKELLFKEASAKRQHRIQAEQNKILFVEASERIEEKDAKPMARQSGGSTLRNSGWNTDWDFVDPTPDIERIKKEVGQKAVHFFRGLQGQGPFQQSAVDLSPNPLAFVFRYIRTIIPDNNEEANQKAMKALDVLEWYMPGFKQFQQDIEHLSIPLNPYFMTSNYSNQNGRVTPEPLQEFLMSEAGRELRLPDGRPVPTASHYKEHAERIQSGDRVRVSDYPNVFRIYSMSEVDNIPNSSWLIQAIDDKADAGYRLHFVALRDTMQQLYQQKLQENQLEARSPEGQTYNYHYQNLYNDIKNWWVDRDKVDLTSFSLRLILKHLKYTGGGVPEVGPDEFRIRKATTPYYSNGWDSSADDPQRNMLTVPPMRQLPRGDVVYDRGNGNMGYDHLILNWKGGLSTILERWGAKSDEWMRMLQQGDIMQQIAQQSPEVFAAWQNVMSLQSGNRTGAENLLDLLSKYPEWNKFSRHHLQKSLSSEIRTVNALLKNGWDGQRRFTGQNLPQEINQVIAQVAEAAEVDPVAASQLLQVTSAELAHLYQEGKIDWDNVTLALSYLNTAHHRNPGVKSNGIVSPRATERESMIDQPGFEALKRYGYQVGKIMDFLYAVMTRCCHEQINTRWNGAEENFYGHQYSTSSGKSSGGDIMLKIAYDQLQATASNDGVEVVEQIGFTLGQRTGLHDPIILRSKLPWQQMVNAFNELYPEAGYQLSEINEPVNRNLEMLEIAVKEALNEARNNVQVKYQNSNGEISILSGEEIASDKMQQKEDAGDPSLIEKEAPPIQPEPQPQPQAVTPQTEPNYDEVWHGDEAPPDYDPSQGFTQMTPTTPKEDQMIKPLEEEPVNYLQKRKNDKRRLFRERTRKLPFSLGSVEDRLVKAANRLDEHGETETADKIDLLLQKLCEVDYVRKTSRL